MRIAVIVVAAAIAGCVKTPASDEYRDITQRVFDVKDREIRLLEDLRATEDPDRRAVLEAELAALRDQISWYTDRQREVAEHAHAEQADARQRQASAWSLGSKILAAILALGMTTVRALT